MGKSKDGNVTCFMYTQMRIVGLVRVTHWTDQDLLREAELRNSLATVQPDFVVNSFSGILSLMGIG